MVRSARRSSARTHSPKQGHDRRLGCGCPPPAPWALAVRGTLPVSPSNRGGWEGRQPTAPVPAAPSHPAGPTRDQWVRRRLVIEVPNVADIYLRLSRPYRRFHFQTAHAVYFSPATLRKVLTGAGFAVESLEGVQRYAFNNALHWLTHRRPQLERPSRRAHSAPAELFDRIYRVSLLS